MKQKVTSYKQVIEISRQDLPLHCPLPDAPLWNAHPRVFLPIEATGEAQCPYCGAMYHLNQTRPEPTSIQPTRD